MAINTSLVWDQEITVPSINKLNDAIKEVAFQFILMAQRENIFLRVPSNGGYISFVEQGISFDNRFSKVMPGDTYHNFGLAFDILPLTSTKYTLDPRADGKLTLTDDKWKRVGQLAKSVGFEWGGEWLKNDAPHPKFDSAHFQFPRTILSLEELKKMRAEQNNRDLVLIPEKTINLFNPKD